MSVNTLAWIQVAYTDGYLKIHQDEADLGVKEKADKQKVSPADPQKRRRCQKQSTIKILNPATKESAVC